MALKTDFTLDEVRTIWKYYRMNGMYPRGIRLSKTATQLHYRYPDISRMSFYKYLSRELEKNNL